MTAGSAPLALSEATELAAAFAQRTADAAGVRILLIKGATLHRHGLRPERASADVDVLVEPAAVEAYGAALEAAGWRRRSGIGVLAVEHSRELVHDGWPCDLDVHTSFPGFLAEPSAVFAALWARRVTLRFAHVDCAAADRVSSVLIMALHALRGASRQPRHAVELELAGSAELSSRDSAELAELARVTGSAATARPALVALGLRPEPTTAELRSPAYREWRSRVAHGAHGAAPWLRAFGAARGHDRLRIALRAIWPTRADLLASTPGLLPRPVALLRARLARLRRGAATLPSALRLLRAERQPSKPMEQSTM